MSRYTSAQPERFASETASPCEHLPDTCGVAGCKLDVATIHVIVRDERGRERSGWWSDFSRSPKALKGGYEFVEWVPRCADHYLRDLYAARKGANSPISGTSPDLDAEAVHAHWAQLGDKP